MGNKVNFCKLSAFEHSNLARIFFLFPIDLLREIETKLRNFGMFTCQLPVFLSVVFTVNCAFNAANSEYSDIRVRESWNIQNSLSQSTNKIL